MRSLRSLTWPRRSRPAHPCSAWLPAPTAAPLRGLLRARIRTQSQSPRPGTRPPSAPPGACGSRPASHDSRRPGGPQPRCPGSTGRRSPTCTRGPTHRLRPRAGAMPAEQRRAPRFRSQHASRRAPFLPAGPAPPRPPAGFTVLQPRLRRRAGGRARSQLPGRARGTRAPGADLVPWRRPHAPAACQLTELQPWPGRAARSSCPSASDAVVTRRPWGRGTGRPGRGPPRPAWLQPPQGSVGTRRRGCHVTHPAGRTPMQRPLTNQ